MKIVFWFFLSLIIFVYFGYPALLIAISFFKRNRFEKDDFSPKVSILIPAHNEERVIEQKLINVFSLDYTHSKLEVILILDKCTDGTKEIALKFINKGLKIIEQKVHSGKMAALNKGVSQAHGVILIFTDANTIFKENAIKKLVRYFKDSKIGGVCGKLIYKDKMNENSFKGEGIYWKYENFIKQLESKVNSLVTANGSIYAIRKTLFSAIDEDLADDLVMPIKIAADKKRFIYEPDAIAWEKPPQKAEEEFHRRVRIINQGFKATFKLAKCIVNAGSLFVFEFLFHKLLRWLVPLFLILVFISNIFLLHLKLYVVFFMIQLIFYIMALLGYVFYIKDKKSKIYYLPFYFCLLNMAALYGLIQFLLRVQTKTWEKAETTR